LGGLSRRLLAAGVGSRGLVGVVRFVVPALVLSWVVGSGALAASARLDGRAGSAKACSQLDVTGTWTTLQSNRYTVTWRFAQAGTRISGSAVLPKADADRAGYTGTVGQLVKGSLVGDRLDVVVQWPARADGTVVRGEYVGTVIASRVSDGQAWDLANPSAKASWTGSGPAKCAGVNTAVYHGPFKVDISFHAQNLPTTPPLDGGTCPGATVQAIVTGKINGQRTEAGDIQGGGDVVATPHLSKCRVPVINFRIVDVQLRVLSPGKRMRLQLAVQISASGVHRPGDCKVSTSGTIVAIYDDTLTVSNGLRDHRLTIGPWQAPGCTAHNDTITNSITSIPADAGSSTWVRVWIGCLATGYSPRNCT
jgi:hypothetical protein